MRASNIVTAGTVAILVAGCSLLVDRGATQCATTSDCTSRGSAFAGTICSADQVCVASTEGSHPDAAEFDSGIVDSGTSDGMATAVDAGTRDVGADSAPAPCTSNTECIVRLGIVPAVCRKDTGRCVGLLSPECKEVIGATAAGTPTRGLAAVAEDDVLVFGSLTSLVGSNQAKGQARVAAIELAVAEINGNTSGLPLGRVSRPLAFLSCNDADLPVSGPGDGGMAAPDAGAAGADGGVPQEPAVTAASKHLIAVGVPAVIGAGNSGLTNTALPLLTKAAHIFMIAPSASAIGLTKADDDGLFWRTAPSDVLQAIPLRDQLGDLQAGVRAALHVPKVKVAIVYKSDNYGDGLNSAVVDGPPALQINGADFNSPSNAAFRISRPYAIGSNPATIGSDVAAGRPNIIAIFGTSEGIDILKEVESAWPANAPRPSYLLSDGLKAAALIALAQADTTSPPLRERIRGTAPSATGSTFDSFAGRFASHYPSLDPRTVGTAGAYDAAYVVAAGLVAGRAKGVNGPAVAAGISHLLPGPKVVLGPNVAASLFSDLAAGKDVDLIGASSPLDFDLATGDVQADIGVWCISPSFALTDSSVRYDAATGKTVGGLPSNFVCQ